MGTNRENPKLDPEAVPHLDNRLEMFSHFIFTVLYYYLDPFSVLVNLFKKHFPADFHYSADSKKQKQAILSLQEMADF